ncbi:hypothetical protein L228DRAFT_141198 [Xylona heveae TC161]|uniref:Uncharacterized protein n=1 Tax=Xylona heveae (strain CBS 132557 / TC161) TaxID=1328760 RepID=A0A161TBE1_XYLHT|nr:hypothetical protein L228DRAFT_141198 [Xylona heveae TC161]KZF22997.1 hypothetical protein L228DRAFT_141198 [Xylona heveae TC161]
MLQCKFKFCACRAVVHSFALHILIGQALLWGNGNLTFYLFIFLIQPLSFLIYMYSSFISLFPFPFLHFYASQF